MFRQFIKEKIATKPISREEELVNTRIDSIDALRGFDMIWIVGGGKVVHDIAAVSKTPFTDFLNSQFEHTFWLINNINGRSPHFWDLIWPLFLFIVGLVLPISIGKLIKQGRSHSQLHLKFLKRMILLIILGWFTRGLLQFNWAKMNYTSVLGDIGIAYFFASLIVLHTKWRMQVIIIAAILILYWLAMLFIPVPGYGAFVMTPQGNLMTYVDNLILPSNPAFRFLDTTGVIMPLFTITCLVLIGALAGQWLGTNRAGIHKVYGLLISGIACVITGYLWGFLFPLIKNMWSSSFIIYTAGWSLLLLTLFYWLIDVRGYKNLAFIFKIIGTNALIVYIFSDMVPWRLLAGIFVGGLARYSGVWNITILDTGGLIIEWLILLHMYRHKIFIKV